MKEQFLKIKNAVDNNCIGSDIYRDELIVYILVKILKYNVVDVNVAMSYNAPMIKNISTEQKRLAENIYNKCFLLDEFKGNISFVDVTSLSETNVIYRFYSNGIEEKINVS